jgi:hypothetical protein
MNAKLNIEELINKNPNADKDVVEQVICISLQIGRAVKTPYRLGIPYAIRQTAAENHEGEDARHVLLKSRRK